MQVRIVPAKDIRDKVIDAIEQITFSPDPAIPHLLNEALHKQTDECREDVLSSLILNAQLATELRVPLCQDTGTLVVFATIGNRVIIDGAPIHEVINEGLAIAHERLYLRASMVGDPIIDRSNTGNACPAIVHLKHQEGDNIILHLAQKGGGAENMSRLMMFSPSAHYDDIERYVVETVQIAGAKACPPLVIGIGLGGNFEMCALLAKRALFSPIADEGDDNPYSLWEKKILDAVNETNIGAQGMGGALTALKVNILSAPCHIASLPVAVNLQCHAHRHIEIRI